jgi:hypothetical protein
MLGLVPLAMSAAPGSDSGSRYLVFMFGLDPVDDADPWDPVAYPSAKLHSGIDLTTRASQRFLFDFSLRARDAPWFQIPRQYLSQSSQSRPDLSANPSFPFNTSFEMALHLWSQPCLPTIATAGTDTPNVFASLAVDFDGLSDCAGVLDHRHAHDNGGPVAVCQSTAESVSQLVNSFTCHNCLDYRNLHWSPPSPFTNASLIADICPSTCASYLSAEPNLFISPSGQCCGLSHANFPFEPALFRTCLGEYISFSAGRRSDGGVGSAGRGYDRLTMQPGMNVWFVGDEPRAMTLVFPTRYMYQETYQPTHDFWTDVQDWTNAALASAPAELHDGFVSVPFSQLNYYSLQVGMSDSSAQSTYIALIIALVVLAIFTRNVLIAIYTTLTVSLIMLTVSGTLSLLGWEEGISTPPHVSPWASAPFDPPPDSAVKAMPLRRAASWCAWCNTPLCAVESIIISCGIGMACDFSAHIGFAYRQANIHREATDRTTLAKLAAKRMGPSLTAAAMSTSVMAAFMCFSSTLFTIRFGIFILLLMSFGWVFALFFLLPLLATIGPLGNCGEPYAFVKEKHAEVSIKRANSTREPTKYDAPTTSSPPASLPTPSL